jgi:Ca2+-binding EF-hand superfamily protein
MFISIGLITFKASSTFKHWQNYLLSRKMSIFLCACVFNFFAIFSLSAPAGPRETQASFEEISKSLGSESANKPMSVPNNAVGVNLDENIRLRRALDEYSRLVDPAHVQIEERRRVMHKRLQERFNQTDRDNDGFISRDEAIEGMPQISRHFIGIDVNNDGFISLDELEALQLKIVERQRMAVRVEPYEADLVKRKTKDASINKPKRSL